ncbi:MAG: DUF3899 domain-containing protein [Eubacteriales bacterium]
MKPKPAESRIRDRIKNLIPFIVSLSVGGLIFAGVFALYGGRGEDMPQTLRRLSDSFLIPGVLFIGIGMLTVISAQGTFDMLRYGIRTFFLLFKRDISKEKRTYRDFYEYRLAMSEKKREYLHLIFAGLVYLLLAVIFLLLFNKSSA